MLDFINPDIINKDPMLLFFGAFYLVLGLSAFLARNHWEEFLELFVKYDALSLVLGIMTLPISLFIIFFYNDWSTLGSTILMVMGYISFVKAAILLLRPNWVQKFLSYEFTQKHMWLDGISGIVLGGAMLIL